MVLTMNGQPLSGPAQGAASTVGADLADAGEGALDAINPLNAVGQIFSAFTPGTPSAPASSDGAVSPIVTPGGLFGIGGHTTPGLVGPAPEAQYAPAMPNGQLSAPPVQQTPSPLVFGQQPAVQQTAQPLQGQVVQQPASTALTNPIPQIAVPTPAPANPAPAQQQPGAPAQTQQVDQDEPVSPQGEAPEPSVPGSFQLQAQHNENEPWNAQFQQYAQPVMQQMGDFFNKVANDPLGAFDEATRPQSAEAAKIRQEKDEMSKVPNAPSTPYIAPGQKTEDAIQQDQQQMIAQQADQQRATTQDPSEAALRGIGALLKNQSPATTQNIMARAKTLSASETANWDSFLNDFQANMNALVNGDPGDPTIGKPAQPSVMHTIWEWAHQESNAPLNPAAFPPIKVTDPNTGKSTYRPFTRNDFKNGLLTKRAKLIDKINDSHTQPFSTEEVSNNWPAHSKADVIKGSHNWSSLFQGLIARSQEEKEGNAPIKTPVGDSHITLLEPQRDKDGKITGYSPKVFPMTPDLKRAISSARDQRNKTMESDEKLLEAMGKQHAEEQALKTTEDALYSTQYAKIRQDLLDQVSKELDIRVKRGEAVSLPLMMQIKAAELDNQKQLYALNVFKDVAAIVQGAVANSAKNQDALEKLQVIQAKIEKDMETVQNAVNSTYARQAHDVVEDITKIIQKRTNGKRPATAEDWEEAMKEMKKVYALLEPTPANKQFAAGNPTPAL